MQGKTANFTGKGKRKPRFSRGFAHTGGLLSAQIRKTSGTRGFSETRLLTQWPEIVGPSIAKIARPIKVSFARNSLGAKLTLLTNGANAPEITMQIPQIIERVNTCYGYNAIRDVHITQSAQTGFSEAPTGFIHDQPTPNKELNSDQTRRLSAQVSDVHDEKLRAMLEKLGRTILLKT